VTAEPDTVHTPGVPEVNDTVSPDDADADNEDDVPAVVPGGWPNVMLCGTLPTAAPAAGQPTTAAKRQIPRNRPSQHRSRARPAERVARGPDPSTAHAPCLLTERPAGFPPVIR
jgi:hypothetical protein